MRFAIVVGHRRDRQGARALSGVHEWAWNIPLAGRLCGELEANGHRADLLFRPNVSTGAMGQLVERINAGDYGAVVSLHFNAGGGGAGGTCSYTTRAVPEARPWHRPAGAPTGEPTRGSVIGACGPPR